MKIYYIEGKRECDEYEIKKVDYCCEKMDKSIKDEFLTYNFIKPVLEIGGAEPWNTTYIPIKYCPFCGEKITTNKEVK